MELVPWFRKHGVRIEYYQFGNSKTQAAIDSAKESGIVVMDNIARRFPQQKMRKFGWRRNTLETIERHCEDIYAKMIQDKSIEPLG